MIRTLFRSPRPHSQIPSPGLMPAEPRHSPRCQTHLITDFRSPFPGMERPLLPNASGTEGGQAPHHIASPNRTTSLPHRLDACLAFGDPSGRTHPLFTMSNNGLAIREQAPIPGTDARADRQTGGESLHVSLLADRSRHMPATRTADPMVESDGIEPTTSCLQSTRSPN